jgi:hypothetical protein
MSISRLIENYNKTKEGVEKNTRKILESAVNNKIKESINEDDELEYDDDQDMPEDDDAVDAGPEMEDEDGEVDLEDDEEMEEPEEDEISGEVEDDADMVDVPAEPMADVPTSPLDQYESDEDGNYHVTLPTEDIAGFIEQLPNSATIVLVKNPTVDVEVQTNENPVGDEMPVDLEDQNEFDGGNDDLEEQEMYTEGMSRRERVLRNKLSLQEDVIVKLRRQLNSAKKKINEQNEKQTEYRKALQKSKTIIESIALTNRKMGHVTNLFTNYALTNKERQEILESFDKKAKTKGESDLLFEVFKKNFSKGKTQKKAKTGDEVRNTLTENVKIVKGKNDKKAVLNEEVTNKTNSTFSRLIGHEI